jgi:heme/copper-type cytochrome/quinol oxidase subunit 3
VTIARVIRKEKEEEEKKVIIIVNYYWHVFKLAGSYVLLFSIYYSN